MQDGARKEFYILGADQASLKLSIGNKGYIPAFYS